jgi:hypothetical protein
MRSTNLVYVTSISVSFFVRVFSCAFAMLMWSGCASTSKHARTCGILLLVDGKHHYPSPQQHAAIARKLEPQFAARDITLVADLRLAKLVATIELVTRSETPGMTDLIVRDVSKNTFVEMPKAVSSPSIREMEIEQARVRSTASDY